MADEVHVPGQVESELPDPVENEAPAPETETPKEEPKEEAPKEEPSKEEDPKPDEGKEEPPKPEKKRSIYADLKEKKHQAKEATARAEAAEAKVAELQALLDKRSEADTPAEEAAADDELAAYAQEEGLDAKSLEKLIGIVSKRIPGAKLSEEDQKALTDFRAAQAVQKQKEEDQAILAEAPKIKEQLSVHDDKELAEIMNEVVRLAHTPEFHDKEVEYIVWKNRDALSKMVSPKKSSFEAGGQHAEAEAGEVDFSKGGITPGQAAQSVADRGRTPGYEIRGGK